MPGQDHIDHFVKWLAWFATIGELMTAKPQVFVTRQCEPGGNSGFIVAGGIDHAFLGWYPLLREFDPLGPGRTAIVPIQSWVSTQDFDAAADQQPDEQQVDVVAQAEPQGKSK